LLVVVTAAILFRVYVGPSAAPSLAQSSARDAATGRAPGEADVGKQCTGCHDNVVESFALDMHGKSAKFLKGSFDAKCDRCHGDPKRHIRSRKPADIINPARLPAAQANETCLTCHSGDKHLFEWKGGGHDTNKMSCMSCHSAHHAKSPGAMLAANTVEDTCLSCHKEQRKALYQRSTHLFRTENRDMKVGCSSCHNPHGGEGRRMLVNYTVNDTCYTCHAEKRGPFLWDHPPVREDCMNCHAPHGSNHPRLLTARASLSCQQCHIHMLPRHSTTAGKPMDIWTLNRGCINCHSQVHGSNHPGGRTFTR
jgi:DmsE family decaheme c-type cytochrome